MMEATMWEKIDDSGLEVWVLPVPAFGPPAADTPYHYIEYVCRPGADLRVAGKRIPALRLQAILRCARLSPALSAGELVSPERGRATPPGIETWAHEGNDMS